MSALSKPKFTPLFVFSALLNLTLGLIPSFLFFAWIERGGTLPWLPASFGWPWLFVDGTLFDQMAWNVGLIFSFGLLHTLMAQLRFPRTLFMVVTGLHCLLILSLWQMSGVVIYQLIPHAGFSAFISVTLFWGLMGVAMKVSSALDPLEFVGLKPAGSTDSTSKKLVTSGWYGRVRHPLYFFTLLAWTITPFMTLDRLLVILSGGLYLWIGIYFEEKKLVREFGEAYIDYKKSTPALFPWPKG